MQSLIYTVYQHAVVSHKDTLDKYLFPALFLTVYLKTYGCKLRIKNNYCFKSDSISVIKDPHIACIKIYIKKSLSNLKIAYIQV